MMKLKSIDTIFCNLNNLSCCRGDSYYDGENLAWRAIFCDRTLNREAARSKIREWGKKVSESRIDLLISAWQTIKAREEDVLNFFINRTSNAAAESLNSKMKGFRSELRVVRDLPFFFYRCCMIFG